MLHKDPDIGIQNDVKEKQRQIDELNKIEAEGAAIRCRAKFQTDGEKPTKFFCNLEKSNAAQKFIPSLFVGVTDPLTPVHWQACFGCAWRSETKGGKKSKGGRG